MTKVSVVGLCNSSAQDLAPAARSCLDGSRRVIPSRTCRPQGLRPRTRVRLNPPGVGPLRRPPLPPQRGSSAVRGQAVSRRPPLCPATLCLVTSIPCCGCPQVPNSSTGQVFPRIAWRAQRLSTSRQSWEDSHAERTRDEPAIGTTAAHHRGSAAARQPAAAGRRRRCRGHGPCVHRGRAGRRGRPRRSCWWATTWRVTSPPPGCRGGQPSCWSAATWTTPECGDEPSTSAPSMSSSSPTASPGWSTGLPRRRRQERAAP